MMKKKKSEVFIENKDVERIEHFKNLKQNKKEQKFRESLNQNLAKILE